jgi:hypothetical protein
MPLHRLVRGGRGSYLPRPPGRSHALAEALRSVRPGGRRRGPVAGAARMGVTLFGGGLCRPAIVPSVLAGTGVMSPNRRG